MPDEQQLEPYLRRRAGLDGCTTWIEPALDLIETCRVLGIEEVSLCGFTKGDVLRAPRRIASLQRACLEFAQRAFDDGAAVLVVGDSGSGAFPPRLRTFCERSRGDIRVNLLVNYDWQWDLGVARGSVAAGAQSDGDGVLSSLGSCGVSPIDLVVRREGCQRVSGFLPIQAAYADVHVIATPWSAMTSEEFVGALDAYQRRAVALRA